MDILSQIGVNVGLVAGVIGICEYLKRLDKKNTFKNFYVVLPIVISALAAILVTQPWDWEKYLINVITYAGVSSLAYNMVIKLVAARTPADPVAPAAPVVPVAPATTPENNQGA
jgi:hypothetical protein